MAWFSGRGALLLLGDAFGGPCPELRRNLLLGWGGVHGSDILLGIFLSSEA